MSDKSLTLSIDLGTLPDFKAAITKEVFPLLNQAVNAVGKQVASNLAASVQKAKLWQGEKDAYAQSISWTMDGDFSGTVTVSYKHAGEIETGRPARDLKKMLGTSTKVRRTKSGKRFLVIPMRHDVKKLEAAGLYGHAKALQASSITGQGQRRSGEITLLSPKAGMMPAGRQTGFLSNPKTKKPFMVPRNQYQWGERLSAKQAGEHKWAAGLYRFNTSAGKGKSSSYLSFRIMMEGQQGWIVPAQPGLFLAKKVVDDMRPKAETAFAMALKKQLG